MSDIPDSVDVETGDSVTIVYESKQSGSEQTRSGGVETIWRHSDSGDVSVFSFYPNGGGAETDVDVNRQTVHTKGKNGYRKLGRLLKLRLH